MIQHDYAIEIKNLTKKFGKKTVVDHVSLRVKKGAIFGFLGSNGSGKTTTIRMICGLLKPTFGSGTCLGHNILTDTEQIKKEIGYMPQAFSFYTGLTVTQNLRFISDIYQVPNSSKRIKQMINDLELQEYKNTKASALSGGWKQRLSLACCLLHQPKLLFLDEPTAGVDPKARKDFWDYLNKISYRDGTTVLVTTHYMDEAEKCTDLSYINVGKLLYAGSTKELLPFSKVETYQFIGKSQNQKSLFDNIHQHHPDLLASIINNELRISSKDHEQLRNFISSDKKNFKKITPSFEEIFIGLMK